MARCGIRVVSSLLINHRPAFRLLHGFYGMVPKPSPLRTLMSRIFKADSRSYGIFRKGGGGSIDCGENMKTSTKRMEECWIKKMRPRGGTS